MTYRRNKTRGFTLTEVLVGLVLLSGMALIVSQVLSQASQVVTLSEEKIRQNSAAAALAEAIRDTLRKASSEGVLCIGHGPDGNARLFVTTAGVNSSVTGSARGTGGCTVLGMAENLADPAGKLLWMRGYVLTRLGGTGSDVWNIDFAYLQSCTRFQADSNISAFYSWTPSFRTPSKDIGDISPLWQVAATGITRLSIQWTDGTLTGGNLNWFGRDINGNWTYQNGGWNGRTAANLDTPVSWQWPEYKDSANNYRVLWTHHNQNYWPKAIRVRFTLTSNNPAMPPEFQNTDYEVIGTVGQ